MVESTICRFGILTKCVVMLSEAHLPPWWTRYDSERVCDYTEFIELHAVQFQVDGIEPHGSRKARKPVRWSYRDSGVEGYILDGNWKDALPFKRFGWVVGASAERIEAEPRLDGLWLIAGEAGSFRSAVKTFMLDIKRAKAILDGQE
jgi:hypothetical protein